MERQMQGEALERMDVYNPEAMRNVAVNYHPTGKTSKRHTHDFYEINYLLRGEAVNEIVVKNARPSTVLHLAAESLVGCHGR